ncbi:putative Fungal-specific transcription factor domain-containing protein [Seiridium unicorne]|uniref:Fungal-specific transcription factor domain-containing protein n=1 Tax=Seiridium unicorne TaxID=138068 RepID=A0ABR2UR46_9PEZI
MSKQPPDNGGDESSARPEVLGLACNRCRKSKLRCSRDAPACQHCRKIGGSCTYETKRVKPGLKAGAVASLHRRLGIVQNCTRAVHQLILIDALEQRFRDRDERDADTGASVSPASSAGSNIQENITFNILSLLSKELPKLVKKTPQVGIFSGKDQGPPRKRTRVDSGQCNVSRKAPSVCGAAELPDDEVLELITIAYFSHVHHWMPMVHQGRYRERMDQPRGRVKLDGLTRAMALVASKYVRDERDTGRQKDLSSGRDWIVSTAMCQLTVESMQSLIIVAFADISSGNAGKAWSVVGSLTRTVNYLQLSIEQKDADRQSLCQPSRLIDSTLDWAELEERRRVFWNVFSLDRFCSVTMGWNTSLTSDDVHRSLPCDGDYWRKQDQVLTPYFSIWDTSAGRIGNPIAFMPAEKQTSDHAISPEAYSQV